MKLKSTVLLTTLLFMGHTLTAQDYQEKEISLNNSKVSWIDLSIEMGFNDTYGDFLHEKWPVRRDVSYSYYGSSTLLHSTVETFYFGIKPEFAFEKGKYSLATGLRYRAMEGQVYNTSYNSSYFYLRYDNAGTDTKYARIKGMNESYHLLGVPVEFKWTPIHFWRIGLYLKAGCEFSFKLSSKVEIDFVNESMKDYEQEILDFVGTKTNSFYSLAYGGFGAIYATPKGLGMALDVLLPVVLTNNNLALMSHGSGNTVQLSFQIPLTK